MAHRKKKIRRFFVFVARDTHGDVACHQIIPKVIPIFPSLDSSENGLADLARTLAATLSPERLRNIHFLLADITSPLFELAMGEIGEIDLVLVVCEFRIADSGDRLFSA